MSKILLEGGLYGHLNHLYDNPDLKFSTIKKIFDTASSGKLVGTEKVDGQNIYLSYSLADKKAKAARNKSNIKQGGMDAQALAAKFADRGALTDAFVQSFEAWERILDGFDEGKIARIFGPDANIWYNAEVMDPKNANVINYDTRWLLLHRDGHAEYDKETAKVVDKDVGSNVKVLEKALENAKQSQRPEDFTVKMKSVQTLKALENDEALKQAFARIGELLSSVGLSDDNTIGEYIVARLSPAIQKSFPSLPEDKQKMIIRKLLPHSDITIPQITKGLDSETKSRISAFVKQEGNNLLGQIIYPLETIVHDFSVEMLKGLKSVYILDNDKEVKRLAGEVQSAIDAIQSSNNQEVMQVMQRHLDKIGGSSEGIKTAIEGFVFDWDGITYKFTGNFAPANQILGLFKYGRGGIPALKKEDIDIIQEATGNKVVGLVPGGYKPPHTGHFMGAKELFDHGADEVIVLISPLEREGFSQDGENKIEVSKRQSLQLWELYIDANGLNGKMKAKIASSPSPVGSTFDYASTLNDGDTVLLGKGEKDEGDDRFKAMQSFLQKKGLDIDVNFANTKMYKDNVSGTTMRRLIADGNLNEFSKHIPLKNKDDIIAAWQIVNTENTQDTSEKEERERIKAEKEAAKKAQKAAEKERKKAEKEAAKAGISEELFIAIERLISEVVRVDHEAVPDGQLGGPKSNRKRKTSDGDGEDKDGDVNVNVSVETNVDSDNDEDKVDEAVGNTMSSGNIEGNFVGGNGKGAWSGLDTEAENDEQESLNKKNRSKIEKAKSDMIKEQIIHLDYGKMLSRNELPQIKSTDVEDFRNWMREEKGIDSFKTKMEVEELSPIQKEINTEKTDSMKEKHQSGEIDLISGKPVMVTMDEFLIDGHHRWYALLQIDPSIEMETINFETTVDEFLQVVKEYPKVSFKDVHMEGYQNFGGESKMIKVGNIRIDLEDVELEPSKHGEERRFRHLGANNQGHKISKDAIVSAVDRAIGLIMNDYANGELSNDEAFHIRMKGSQKIPALNVIAALDMKKGPDIIKIITVMRKDDFKTDNFGGGKQKTYEV